MHEFTRLSGWILLTGLLLQARINAGAQTKPMFSQYNFNMLTLNPAYAGNRSNLSLNAIYRRQWIGMDGAPDTWMVSADGKLNAVNSASYGIQLYNDQLGIEKSTGIQAYYSHHIALSPVNDDNAGNEEGTTLSVGLGFGIMNYSADFTKLNAVQSGDPRLTLVNGYTPTAGFGILVHSYKWYVGVSAPSLLRSKVNNDHTANVSSLLDYNELFMIAGYVLGGEHDAVKIKPSVLLKVAQGAPLQCDFSLNAWFNNYFMAGLSYRTKDAIVGMVELQTGSSLRIGYSYDYTTSNLSSYNSGTHEIMLRYEILTGKKNGYIASPPIRYY